RPVDAGGRAVDGERGGGSAPQVVEVSRVRTADARRGCEHFIHCPSIRQNEAGIEISTLPRQPVIDTLQVKRAWVAHGAAVPVATNGGIGKLDQVAKGIRGWNSG